MPSALLFGPVSTAQLISSTNASREARIFLFFLNSIICTSLSLRFFFSVANVVAITPAGREALAAIDSSVSPYFCRACLSIFRISISSQLSSQAWLSSLRIR